MSKTQVVVFTKNNARILINPETIPDGAVVNPDLSAVRGVAPHYWKLGDEGKIVPMTDDEVVARDAHLSLHGADNAVFPEPTIVEVEPLTEAHDESTPAPFQQGSPIAFGWIYFVAVILALLALGYLLHFAWK